MAKICSVPISFLVLRGQSIKLTSFIAKKCREKRTLMPVIERSFGNESYEGAICLPPKCNLYLDNPVACLDYSSLYPSSMISENLSQDSKVWTKEFDLAEQLVRETGVKDISGNYIYDNLPGYEYVDVTYDTYKWVKNQRGRAIKTLNGTNLRHLNISSHHIDFVHKMMHQVTILNTVFRNNCALRWTFIRHFENILRCDIILG